MIKALSILFAASALFCIAIAEEASSVGKDGKAALVDSLVGPTSVFLECGQSDTWESVDLLKQRYGLTDADMAVVMADVLEKTIGETNAARKSVRAGAAMMLGRYGTVDSIPLLRNVALAKEDPAAPLAFQSYQALASLDKVVELVDATYDDPDCNSYRRMRGIFFWQTGKKVRDGDISAAQRSNLCAVMRKRAASGPDVRDVLEIDELLSLLDRDYASSRERMINIGKALNSGRPVDSFIMSNVRKRLEAARDLVLEADRKKAVEAADGAGKGAGK